jgi:F-type H+-transporting ATPase subunit epsilon
VLAMLDPTELRLYKTESEVVRFAQAEGYLQMADNHALILVEEAMAPGDLDAGSLRERLQQAERELESAGEDSEKRRFAERDKARLEQFLKIAEG